MSATSQRKKSRKKSAELKVLRICLDETSIRPRWLTADLLDHSEDGLGIALAFPLNVGANISVRGTPGDGSSRRGTKVSMRVVWCLERQDGSYGAGLVFHDTSDGDQFNRWEDTTRGNNDSEEDYYEILQLSPNADPDTIQRVYRMTAQRFHPDNAETGDEETFKRLLEAYRVLKDPEQRAAL